MKITASLPRRSLPRFLPVKQFLPTDRIDNTRGDVARKLLAAGLKEKVTPGARIGITAGSCGIGEFINLLAGIVDAVKSAGGNPFVFPAMGSHGGATAEGQSEILPVLPRRSGQNIRACLPLAIRIRIVVVGA